jgi:AbrB family looped-hinge helix DNA binding protein
MAIQATIIGKNQITIPAAIARALHIEPGMQLEFELNEDNSLVVRPVESRAELARRLQGKWRYLLQPGDDPIGDLIRERVEEDEASN